MQKILLIEDDEAVRNVIQDALAEKYKVVATDDTRDILGLIRENNPDLVLMDYILPNINGGELCHLIKTTPSTENLPVIIISGYPRVLYSLGSYGCDAILEKPFDLEKLFEVLDQFQKPVIKTPNGIN